MSPRASASPAARETDLAQARHRFMDDLGHLYSHYGLSVTFGRAFALLLISDEPISLEDLSTQLEVSKSAVSVAARDLARAGIARRVTTPGSRRVMYEAGDDMVPIFGAMFERVRRSLPVLQEAIPLTRPGRASRRVREMIELHEFWLAEAEGVIDRWRRRMRRVNG